MHRWRVVVRVVAGRCQVQYEKVPSHTVPDIVPRISIAHTQILIHCCILLDFLCELQRLVACINGMKLNVIVYDPILCSISCTGSIRQRVVVSVGSWEGIF